MKLKTRKAIINRFKITKGGVFLHRPIGQNHFNAKYPGKTTRRIRKYRALSKSEAKVIRKMIHYIPR